MKGLIQKLLRESLINEEYDGNELYGYHVTSIDNVESINKNGFSIGHRSMQGKGVYSFYDINHAIRYASKGEINDPVIIKFKITAPTTLLYLNMRVAKEVLGSDYHLKTQIDRKYWGKYEKGLLGFLEGVRQAYKRDITMEQLIVKLDEIETNNSEMNQRTFWSSMIPADWNNNLNILLDGNYGIEFRINNPRIMYVVGYHVVNPNGKLGELLPFEKDEIPSGSEFDELRKWKTDTGYDLPTLEKMFDNKQMESRRNDEYDYYDGLIKQIEKLLYR